MDYCATAFKFQVLHSYLVVEYGRRRDCIGSPEYCQAADIRGLS